MLFACQTIAPFFFFAVHFSRYTAATLRSGREPAGGKKAVCRFKICRRSRIFAPGEIGRCSFLHLLADFCILLQFSASVPKINVDHFPKNLKKGFLAPLCSVLFPCAHVSSTEYTPIFFFLFFFFFFIREYGGNFLRFLLHFLCWKNCKFLHLPTSFCIFLQSAPKRMRFLLFCRLFFRPGISGLFYPKLEKEGILQHQLAAFSLARAPIAAADSAFFFFSSSFSSFSSL